MKAKIQAKAQGNRAMEKNGHWKGGRYTGKEGYVHIRITSKVERLEHTWLMEQLLKRPLYRNEVVHHKNEDRTDNRIENLELMTISEHLRFHNTGDRSHKRKTQLARIAQNVSSPV